MLCTDIYTGKKEHMSEYITNMYIYYIFWFYREMKRKRIREIRPKIWRREQVFLIDLTIPVHSRERGGAIGR